MGQWVVTEGRRSFWHRRILSVAVILALGVCHAGAVSASSDEPNSGVASEPHTAAQDHAVGAVSERHAFDRAASRVDRSAVFDRPGSRVRVAQRPDAPTHDAQPQPRANGVSSQTFEAANGPVRSGLAEASEHHRSASLMVASSARLAPIQIESLRATIEAEDATAPVSVRDRDSLEIEQARDLGDVLREMPGVGVSGGPRATAIQPVIRGLGGERVVIRLDGARQNFASGHRGRVFLDPFLLERVEVLRGPSSTLYGSGALGGVVSFRTLDARGFLGEATRGGRLTAAYSSQGDERLFAGSAAVRDQDDRYGVLASILSRESSDRESGDGERIPLTGDDIVSGLARADFAVNDHRFGLGLQAFRDDHRLPSAANTSSLDNIVDRRTDSRTLTARYRYDPESPWINLDATVYRTEIELDERRVTDGRRDGTDLDTTGIDVANVSVIEAGVPGRLIAGFEALRDTQSGTRDAAPRPQFPDATRTTSALFLQYTAFLGDRFELTPGLRIDRTRFSANDRESRSDSETSKSLAARFSLTPDFAFVAQYAEAFRSPSLTDLYVGGLHFPGNVFVPNPDLRPERAKNREIGLVYGRSDQFVTGDRIDARLNVFRTDFDDFIEQRVVFDPIVGRPMGPPMGRTFSDNVLDARINGAELELDYRTDNAFIRATATRLRGRNRSDGDALGGIPADELSLAAGRWLFNRDWLLGARVTAVATQDRVRADASETPGYTLWDAFVTWQPARFDRRMRVDFRVDNLTDRQYRPHNSALPDPGRNLSVRASWQF